MAELNISIGITARKLGILSFSEHLLNPSTFQGLKQGRASFLCTKSTLRETCVHSLTVFALSPDDHMVLNTCLGGGRAVII
jgi:hypothetical protein